MNFAIIMINVFALAAFIVFWLSFSYIAYDLYKTNSNNSSAITIARISNILKYLLIIWFILLGIVFATADTPVAMIIFLGFFIGLTILTRKLYGNILNAVSSISKDDGSKKSQVIIYKQLNDMKKQDMQMKAIQDFNRLKLFFVGLNSLITISVLLNFWLDDANNISTPELIFASIAMIILLQIIFLPIYYISKKIITATLMDKK